MRNNRVKDHQIAMQNKFKHNVMMSLESSIFKDVTLVSKQMKTTGKFQAS